MPLKVPHWINPSIWKHILTLVSGAGASQLVTLISLPVLSRLYPPDEFGILAVFLAIIAVLTIAINGGYDMALMLPESDIEARNILSLCLRIALGTSILFALLSWAFADQVLMLLKAERMNPWHHLLAISLLAGGLTQPLRIYLSRLQQYKIIAKSRIIRAVVQAAISIGLGLTGTLFEGLIIGFVAGQVAGVVPLYMSFRLRKSKASTKDEHTLRGLARKYRDFPTYALVGNWLNNASRYLPFFFIPVLFWEAGTAEAINGWLQKADRVLSLPIVLVSMSVGAVFFERGAKAFQEGLPALRSLTKQTLLQVVLLGFPFLIVIVAFAPNIFVWVLGSEWEEAGKYAQWLMPWFYLIFITTPLSWLVDIRRKLKVMLWISLLFFIFRGGLFLLWKEGSISQLIQAYGGMNVLLVLGQLLYYLYLGGIGVYSFFGKEEDGS